MSRPPINPEKTVAGISLDPQTLDRVIPESRRPDGTVRKQIKIRPGFTPQEDVRRFRGTKQTQMDSNALPKGHIIGWAPPPKSTAPSTSDGKAFSKSAKKNAKRKEKREKEKADVPDNWDDDDDNDGEPKATTIPSSTNTGTSGGQSSSTPAPTTVSKDSQNAEDDLTDKLGKLEVK